MTSRFNKSRHMLLRAFAHDAALSARPGVLANGYADEYDDYPVFADKASGAYVWDYDGRKYIDLVLGFGCVFLGHNHPSVNEAVMGALQRGNCPTLACSEQIELAERLSSVIPNAEMSFFLRTGSDATSLAVRLARAATGRSTVLQWGYHGWHDWCAPSSAGTVSEHRVKTKAFEYNSLDSLETAILNNRGDVACVIMMPFEVEQPQPGFFEGVRALCKHHSALLVFDEVRSGFRVALGGAQEYLNVDADLICLSKAIGNGHPLSVLCGRADLMRLLRSVSASSTFFRCRDGFAAGLATLSELETAFAIDLPGKVSSMLCTAFETAISASGAPFVRVGHHSMPFLSWPGATTERELQALRTFCSLMLDEGVLLHPTHHWFCSLALSKSDIDHVQAAAERVLCRMRDGGVFEITGVRANN